MGVGWIAGRAKLQIEDLQTRRRCYRRTPPSHPPFTPQQTPILLHPNCGSDRMTNCPAKRSKIRDSENTWIEVLIVFFFQPENLSLFEPAYFWWPSVRVNSSWVFWRFAWKTFLPIVCRSTMINNDKWLCWARSAMIDVFARNTWPIVGYQVLCTNCRINNINLTKYSLLIVFNRRDPIFSACKQKILLFFVLTSPR